jgi:tetratricopeptide (TPR) repeat protein
VYEKAGNLPEAKRVYQKAMVKDPANYVAASNLGNIYYQNGNYETAFLWYRKALAICPGYVPALNNLANAQMETQDYAAATENLYKAIEAAETKDEKQAIYLSFASLYKYKGNNKESEKWTAKAEETRPETIIPEVPFFKQTKYHCGPAALACIYNFHGVRQSAEEISERIYSRDKKGSLNLQLLIDAREQGLTATMYSGSFEKIKQAVDSGTPLILMLSEGADALHYVVVFGYEGSDLPTIITHNGYEPHKKYSRETLEKKWRPTGYCIIEIK